MTKLYFAHPVSTYGTADEAQMIAALAQGGFDVVNPSGKAHQDKVLELRGKFNDVAIASREIMVYFVEVCNSCDACAALPFPDGKLGAGVVKEMQSFFDRGLPVYEAAFAGGVLRLEQLAEMPAARVLDVETTRAYLKRLSPKP